MRTHTLIDSPMGTLTLVATDGVLSGLYMEQHLRMPDPSTFGPRVGHGFEETVEQLAEYFAGLRREFTVPVRLEGGDFQRRVWDVLRTIPYGQRWSYTRVADAIGRPDRVRAVGAANARNPVAVIVPCHRVVGGDGALTGFSGGLARKGFLLELESPARQGSLF
ncbi:methylated-DNA--protein-cysteine methyltransferase [Streptosporangium carneum]|uniref:Methylated-DNA--protein-cysteine methyltransferase n=2 Tax=Streptosporangium carneum TaxID=47481 RepID=A0A9W6MET6_9ACTN|nr:methylated-DNA--protein-cysteine methyltransferase [Streptosporangium carneum]